MTAGLLLLLAVLMFLGRHDETIADWLARREREHQKEGGVLADLADKGSRE